MNSIEILTKQTEDAYSWTNKLISSIPNEKWDRIPETVGTNVTWQIGHLIMSFYYHSIMVIAGHQMDILQKMPLKEYGRFFTEAPPENSLGKTNSKELQNHLMLVQQKSVNVIRSLSEKDLENKLEPSEIPHPIAKNKFDALDWNIKHTMWHCGQIGILKRVVDERYDFGLRKGN